mmetsp:Transcript_42752/g.50023  ORF Transcript_42752/g.50023 Transcript_42752/m.50023 type:complete len:222 (-) Transcript_42752:193-858(-)
MKCVSALVTLFASCTLVVNAFVSTAPQRQQRDHFVLAASTSGDNFLKTTFTTVGALLLSSLVILDDASAIDLGSSELMAARSGGRGGGRASMSRPMPRASPSRSYSAPVSRGATYIAPTRIYQRPIIMSPFGYSPFGYGGGGFGGFGLGYGLGAMGRGGGGGVNQQVQYEQQKDLAQTTAELEITKQKEADLEQRIKALESGGAVQPAQVAPALVDPAVSQ